MSKDQYIEIDVTNTESILGFIKSIKNQKTELILSSNGKQVGAILTAEQYEWFLDQLDAQQDLESINARSSDMDDAQNLSDFKKELDK